MHANISYYHWADHVFDLLLLKSSMASPPQITFKIIFVCCSTTNLFSFTTSPPLRAPQRQRPFPVRDADGDVTVWRRVLSWIRRRHFQRFQSRLIVCSNVQFKLGRNLWRWGLDDEHVDVNQLRQRQKNNHQKVSTATSLGTYCTFYFFVCLEIFTANPVSPYSRPPVLVLLGRDLSSSLIYGNNT